jgi:hypothetical protein
VRKHYEFGQVGWLILPDLQKFHDREVMFSDGIQGGLNPLLAGLVVALLHDLGENF